MGECRNWNRHHEGGSSGWDYLTADTGGLETARVGSVCLGQDAIRVIKFAQDETDLIRVQLLGQDVAIACPDWMNSCQYCTLDRPFDGCL